MPVMTKKTSARNCGARIDIPVNAEQPSFCHADGFRRFSRLLMWKSAFVHRVHDNTGKVHGIARVPVTDLRKVGRLLQQVLSISG